MHCLHLDAVTEFGVRFQLLSPGFSSKGSIRDRFVARLEDELIDRSSDGFVFCPFAEPFAASDQTVIRPSGSVTITTRAEISAIDFQVWRGVREFLNFVVTICPAKGTIPNG
ncbi:MAG: hypothetical protein B7C54_06445 [Acidimicrobiales bacterium mtb01]|nr:MAG: hypothetical protein B7C54_06445 [Acidimicrobiales bacterium mtb01]